MEYPRPDLNVVGSAIADIFQLHEERNGFCDCCGGKFPCLTVSFARLAWEEIGREVDKPEEIEMVRVSLHFDMEKADVYRFGGDDLKTGSWTGGRHCGITCESVAASLCQNHDQRLGYIGFEIRRLPRDESGF